MGAVGSEVVLVDEIPFPSVITTSKPLALLGHGKPFFSVSAFMKRGNVKLLMGKLGFKFTGITDIEIHFLQIKFTAIGVYLDPEIVGHLQKWKTKKGTELAEDDDFFDALISGIYSYNIIHQ